MTLVTTEIKEVNQRKIAYLYLDNPETRNSMTWDMGIRFKEEIEKLNNSSEKISCLILTGKNNIFSSGGDLGLLRSFKDQTFEKNSADMYEFYNNFLSIRTLPFPTIAAVNGHAVGAALSLALACDLRVFSTTSKYSFNFVKLAIHPGMGSSYIVRELFGGNMANTLLMMAEAITGEDAKEMSLCQDAVAQPDVVRRAAEMAINISESGPLALRLLKQNSYNHEELQKALRREAEAQSKCFMTNDFLESLNSIIEKRKPEFKDD
ncbi:MAG: enoyl-CoA hydratase/isomerase family protein [Leptospiraceae bacterium]|nr:enoyl-CoA hydratase/isomerase family protein [Leptospiraceae bacterium]MCP5510715.1 enoyl-CoA hydratase/isomerase family protein [Leptospiraceae bacterium]